MVLWLRIGIWAALLATAFIMFGPVLFIFVLIAMLLLFGKFIIAAIWKKGGF